MMRAASLPAVALPVAPAEEAAAGGAEDGEDGDGVMNGGEWTRMAVGAGGESPESGGARGRGLHSPTFQLSLSRF
jgi:hypothetical protein